MKWIKDRRAFAQRTDIAINRAEIPRRAPGMLWAFGEIGADTIYIPEGWAEELVAECKRLFPEAQITPLQASGNVGIRPRKKPSRPATQP